MKSLQHVYGAKSPSAGGINVQIVDSLDELVPLEKAWRLLFGQSPTSSSFLKWEWISGWWRHFGTEYGQRGAGLRIVLIWRGDVLVGALPLYINRRSRFAPKRLMLISTGEAEFEETCADYLDLLCDPDDSATCLASIAEVISSGSVGPWDECLLSGMSEDACLAGLSGILQRQLPSAIVSTDGVFLYANMTGGYDEYLDRLSSGVRKQERRLMRQIEQQDITFEVAPNAGEALKAFDELVSLHEARWSAKDRSGAFSSLRFQAFHRELIRELAPKGEALIGKMAVGNKPLAVIYGFRHRDKFDFYQCGIDVDPPVKLDSPGIAANLLFMRHLSAEGVTLYDFLKGASAYKERLATDRGQFIRLTISKPSVRTVTRNAVTLAKRIIPHPLQLRPKG